MVYLSLLGVVFYHWCSWVVFWELQPLFIIAHISRFIQPFLSWELLGSLQLLQKYAVVCNFYICKIISSDHGIFLGILGRREKKKIVFVWLCAGVGLLNGFIKCNLHTVIISLNSYVLNIFFTCTCQIYNFYNCSTFLSFSTFVIVELLPFAHFVLLFNLADYSFDYVGCDAWAGCSWQNNYSLQATYWRSFVYCSYYWYVTLIDKESHFLHIACVQSMEEL